MFFLEVSESFGLTVYVTGGVTAEVANRLTQMVLQKNRQVQIIPVPKDTVSVPFTRKFETLEALMDCIYSL